MKTLSSLATPSEIAFCRPRRPAEILAALSRAQAAIIDATENPRWARRALALALKRLDPRSIAVYTEKMYEGLELFVRSRGVLLLFGPLETSHWEAVSSRLLAGENDRPPAERRLDRPASAARACWNADRRPPAQGWYPPVSDLEHNAG